MLPSVVALGINESVSPNLLVSLIAISDGGWEFWSIVLEFLVTGDDDCLVFAIGTNNSNVRF